MHVLDALRQVTDPTKSGRLKIRVPAVHKGHLGALPGTEVHFLLPPESPELEQGLELLIRSYPLKEGQQTILQCTMLDLAGVVDKLVQAVSSLKINILFMESTGLNAMRQHLVCMGLDWSTSNHPGREGATAGQRQVYRDYQALFPLERRYIELFESIVLHCGTVLAYRDERRELPMISLEDITTPPFYTSGQTTSTIEAGTPTPPNKVASHVEIEIPQIISTRLLERLGTAKGDLPWYVLTSDTETRTLRVLFVSETMRSRLLRVGLFHANAPGALGAILGPLARADFSILNQLIRPSGPDTNVLEMLLVDQREAPDPPMPLTDSVRYEWLARLIVAHAGEDREKLQRFNFRIGQPRYRQATGIEPELLKLNSFFDDNIKPAPPPQSAESEEGMEALTPLMELVERARALRDRSVFVSWPVDAAEHCELIKRRMEKKGYQFLDATSSTSQYEPILRCDCFVGIWLQPPDSRQRQDYLIAQALEKPCVLLHRPVEDDHLPERVSGHRRIQFTDLYFERRTLGELELAIDDLEKSISSGTAGSRGSAALTPQADIDASRSKKVHVIKRVIEKLVATGVSSVDLRQALKDEGVDIEGPYFFSALKRLRDSGQIFLRDGRYFPVKE